MRSERTPITTQEILPQNLVTPEQLKGIPKVLLLGYFASGKSTAAEFLKERAHFGQYSFSRNIAIYADLVLAKNPQDRSSYYQIGVEMNSRFGTYFQTQWLLREVVCDMSTADSIVGLVIDGTRDIRDIDFLKTKKLGNALSIWINTPENVRQTFFMNRSRSIDKETVFAERDQIERQLIEPMRELADVEVNNNGSLEQFHQEITDVVVQRFPGILSE